MATMVELPQSLTRAWVEAEGRAFLGPRSPGPLTMDFSNTAQIDSAGLAFLQYLGKQHEKAGRKLVLRNVKPDVLAAIDSSHARPDEEPAPAPVKETFFSALGRSALASWDTAMLAVSMLAEILYWASFGLLAKRDFRKGVIEQQMFYMGYGAFGIVGLLSFLVGIVLALQAAMQLERFGGGIFLAPMIAISMIKELGPLLTAVILTGRTGSATTAEIATMVVGEEVDALKTMGINPIQFIVVPKLFAFTITMPLLSVAASLMGIVGGYLVAITYLKITSGLFISELIKYVALNDVVANVVKSVVFSWLIIWIGSFHGFRVKGGAEEVGRETTASVVDGIFIIIVADSIFSFIFL